MHIALQPFLCTSLLYTVQRSLFIARHHTHMFIKLQHVLRKPLNGRVCVCVDYPKPTTGQTSLRECTYNHKLCTYIRNLYISTDRVSHSLLRTAASNILANMPHHSNSTITTPPPYHSPLPPFPTKPHLYTVIAVRICVRVSDELCAASIYATLISHTSHIHTREVQRVQKCMSYMNGFLAIWI